MIWIVLISHCVKWIVLFEFANTNYFKIRNSLHTSLFLLLSMNTIFQLHNMVIFITASPVVRKKCAAACRTWVFFSLVTTSVVLLSRCNYFPFIILLVKVEASSCKGKDNWFWNRETIQHIPIIWHTFKSRAVLCQVYLLPIHYFVHVCKFLLNLSFTLDVAHVWMLGNYIIKHCANFLGIIWLDCLFFFHYLIQQNCLPKCPFHWLMDKIILL